ncbi:MAG TPA: zinc ribbon domain-containing protein, partial [Ramlibacter sp.]|nr:zinc ribbon domain-containing protein [Ramlibacter sp.]
MQATPIRAIPRPTPLTQPFWDATKSGALAIQRCAACRRFFHPPTPVCLECRCAQLAFETVSGRGRIHARTIMYDPRVQGFA